MVLLLGLISNSEGTEESLEAMVKILHDLRLQDGNEGVEVPSEEGGLYLSGYSTREVAVFSSGAAEIFKQREFQGLQPATDAESSTDIVMGLHGVASSYRPNNVDNTVAQG